MKKIDRTARELIDFCNDREDEVCNYCENFKACGQFIKLTGHIPYRMERSEYYTNDIVFKE